MSESGDYNPGVWKGDDFKKRRDTYDSKVGRGYEEAVSSGKQLKDMLQSELTTKCKRPLLISCDDTGSMGGWPNTIFSKLPYLDLEGQEYLGKDMEISFGAFNDAYTGVRFPIQSRPFTKGKDLENEQKVIVRQGGGGGQMSESSELAMLYYARKVNMPKTSKPILVLITDEKPYDFVNPDQAAMIGVTLKGRLMTKDLVDELMKRYALYVILKPYNEGSGDASSENSGVRNTWVKLVGSENIAFLPDPNRVVDVIFAILAKETERLDYFEEEIKGRQRADQVETVLDATKAMRRSSKPDSAPKPKKAERGSARKKDGATGTPKKGGNWKL